MSAQEREALTPIEAEAVLLDAYVDQGLRESGEKSPTKRLLLAVSLMAEAESLLASVVTAERPVPAAGEVEAATERVRTYLADIDAFYGDESVDVVNELDAIATSSPLLMSDLRLLAGGVPGRSEAEIKRFDPATWCHGTCPRCGEYKFIGHGPLCVDCYISDSTGTEGGE